MQSTKQMYRVCFAECNMAGEVGLRVAQCDARSPASAEEVLAAVAGDSATEVTRGVRQLARQVRRTSHYIGAIPFMACAALRNARVHVFTANCSPDLVTVFALALTGARAERGPQLLASSSRCMSFVGGAK